MSNRDFKLDKFGNKAKKIKIPTNGNDVINQEIINLKNRLEHNAKKYNIDISSISFGKNEAHNILKLTAKINSQIPKGTGKQTTLSKQMYKDKYDSLKFLTKNIKNGSIKGKYIWDIDYLNGKKYASIYIKAGNGERFFHLDLNLNFVPKYLKNRKKSKYDFGKMIKNKNIKK